MKAHQSGFTIFELLITLAVTAIVSGGAMLGLSNIRSSFDKNEARYQLEADLKVLRNAAIESGARSFLIIGTSGSSYSGALDYSPYAATPSAERTLFSRSLPRGINLSSSATVIVNPKGFTIDTSGAISSTTLTLSFRSSTFLAATLYPTGVLA
jgi:prepilin-type N-terminal cleavage/methylation domain-containing protein